MRLVSVRVLPVPAPATIRRGPACAGASAASFCLGLRSGGEYGSIGLISTIVSYIWDKKKPFLMAIFVPSFLILLGVIGVVKGEGLGKEGILGGPGGPDSGVTAPKESAKDPSYSGGEAIGALVAGPAVDNMGTDRSNADFPTVFGEEEAFPASLRGGGKAIQGGSEIDGLFTYKVKRGDTIAKIAKTFGISSQTIESANPNTRGKKLVEGQEISILPVSGIVYRLKEGEAPDEVAVSYGISLAELQEANQTVNLNQAGAGTALVVPGAREDMDRGAQALSGALPDLGGYFGKPTDGFNWGRLHARNAVDIANACGTPVVAAAEGLVSLDGYCNAEEGWNGGYGICVSLEHPNHTRTWYAHLSRADVSVGDYVEKGKIIGAMGETGEATGCHLHFGVDGAKNPLVK